MTELLTPEEAAKILGVSARSIISLAKREDDKRLPAAKIANEWRFRAEDVRKYLDRIFGEASSDK